MRRTTMTGHSIQVGHLLCAAAAGGEVDVMDFVQKP